MLKIVQILLQYFDSKNIKYCHWKSNIHLQAALEGKTDLDMLIDVKDSIKVLDTFNSLDIKQVRSPEHQQYPSISDYIGYDKESGKFIHIHLHFQIVLGSSGLKEYHFPIEELFLNNLRKEKNVFVPICELELILFILRLSFKRSYYYILRLHLRNMLKTKREDEYIIEFYHLISKINFEKYEQFVDKLPINSLLKDKLIDIVRTKKFPSKISSQLVVASFSEFRRISFFNSLFLKLYKVTYSKFMSLNKLDKKEPFTGGISVAIVGIDGTGKTTLVDSLKKKLSWKFRVSHNYFGSNKYNSMILWVFVFPFLAVAKIFPNVKIFKLGRAFSWLIMEWGYFKQREKAYFKSFRTKSKGSISLCERYPLENYSDWVFSTVDLKGEEENFLIQYFKNKLTSKYKNRFLQPDIMIVLIADSSESYKRKPDHSFKLISDKYEKMMKFVDENKNNKRVYIIDSTIGKEEVLKKSLEIIWNNI